MIDPTLPLELDDEREVRLVNFDDKYVRVQVLGEPFRKRAQKRKESAIWSYFRGSGIFVGGNQRDHFILRNREDDPTLYVPDLV